MNVINAIRDVITQCGQEVVLHTNESEHRFTACVFPFRTEQKDITPFGVLDPNWFTYYGPLTGGGEHAREGAVLKAGEDTYLILSCSDFVYRGERLFRRAEVQRVTGGAADEPVYNA